MAPPPLPGNQQPVIIIKKKRKRRHDAHHGGAWKVAYADFVTAMMAFFLLLWLLNVTTHEQRAGIADYFSPASVSRSTSGSGGVLGGLTITVPGAMISPGAPVSFAQPTPSRAGESEKEPNQTSEEQYDRAGMSTQQIEEKALREEMAKREQRQFEEAEKTLRQAIQGIPELAQLAESLMIEQTPEGLRIQILDQANYSMFPLGSSQMYIADPSDPGPRRPGGRPPAQQAVDQRSYRRHPVRARRCLWQLGAFDRPGQCEQARPDCRRHCR